MASTLTKIEFFYDLISPYSYLALEILSRYKHVWQLDLILKPVLMGGIVAKSENKSLFLIPNKLAYLRKDLERVGKHYGIVFADNAQLMVEAVERNYTLPTQRFLTSLSIFYPSHLEPISRQLFNGFWSKGEDIFSVDYFEQAAKLANMKPEDIANAVSNINNDEVKEKLKQVTQEALNNGAFGLPVLIIHTPSEKHMVFGSDRFHIISDMIGKPWLGPFPNASKL